MKPLGHGFQRRARLLGCALLILLTLAMLAAPALAAEPLIGTFSAAIIGREAKFDYKGRSVNRWAGYYSLKLDTGPEVPVLCIEAGIRVNYGDRYRSDGPVQQLPKGCQIRYLLDKYPASSAKTDDEAAARQLAVWTFSDGIDPATIVDTALRDRVLALVDEANQAPCPATRVEVPALTIDPPAASATAGQTITYTLRIMPPGAASSVAISLAGPATFPDGSRQANLALNGQGAGTFALIGAGAGESTIDASLPYQLDAGLVFSPLDDTHKTQRLVMGERQTFTARATARAMWNGGAPPPAPTTTPSPVPTGAAPPPATAQATAAPPGTQPTATPKQRPTDRDDNGERQPTEQPQTQTMVAGATAQPADTPAPPTPTIAAPQPAGGAPPAGPQQLPKTGAPPSSSSRLWLAIAAALLVSGGIALRRRRAPR